MKPGPSIVKGAAAGAVVGVGMGLLFDGMSLGQGVVGGAITGALVIVAVRVIPWPGG